MEENKVRVEVCEHTQSEVVQEKFGEEWVCIHEETREQELENIKQVKQQIMGRFEVLSPDRVTIEFDIPYYTSKEKAFEAFDNWKKRYEFQGYYSSVDYGRIPLEELEDYMYVREISNNN